MNFCDFIEDGIFSPTLIAAALKTTESEMASTLGLGQSAFSRAKRLRAKKTQTRLRHMLEILSRANHSTSSLIESYVWYRTEPIVGFGGQTASSLVREGNADYVHEYFERKWVGGHA
ncbi:MAG: hypothetical protein OXH88_08570 [Gammaproteobacteria bacterium]|nr:hypothetical protein [Gammaproteobacteria bacterium]